MKKLLSLTVGIVLSAALMSSKSIQESDGSGIRLREDNIPQVIQEMTLEEKATLVVGGGFKSMLAGSLGERGVLVPGAAGITQPIERLGIPSIVLSDGPAGVRIEPTRKRNKGRTYSATAFPSGTLMASTWNVDMVREVGRDLGNEALEYGVDVMLGPGMNLHRNPLTGRNFEYYSEDPVLTGKIAAAMIDGIQSNGVGTSAKHFALNNQETCRNGNDARADERTMRELYLKGFEIAVKEAAPWTIMSSYNRINGEWAQSNRWLLTEVLREEWGFDGVVMTDWSGKRNTANQVIAGNDLMEPGFRSQKREIIRSVKSGILKESDLDLCVERILRLIVKTPRFKGYAYSDNPDLNAHAMTARTAAAEGIVLLKNDGALPLREIRNIALYGNTGYQTCAGGTGSGNVHAPYVVNISDALKDSGFNLEAGAESFYQDYLKKNKGKGGINSQMLGKGLPEEPEIPEECINPDNADIAIFVVGRQAGEGLDRTLEGDFMLSATEMANLSEIAADFHSKGKDVIVILNTGGSVETSSWDSLCDALIALWQPGEEGASALADILSGKVNPSGKLTMTFPVDYMDIPGATFFPYEYDGRGSMNAMGKYRDKGRENIDYTEYKEGLNVGYRYFTTSGVKTSYPFGHGLSYTTFGYDEAEVSQSPDGNINISIRITNTGDTDGKEVVQVYVSDLDSSSSKPAMELKAFAKTELLAPGASEVLEMEIPPYILSSFNESTSSWEMPQRIEVLIGASSEDIRSSATFAVSDMPAYKVTSNTPEKRAEDLLKRLSIEEKASLMVNASAEIEHLGIKAYNWWNEALHGVARNGSATVFPQPIGMASSFDTEKIEEVFSVISNEARIKNAQSKVNGGAGQYQGLTFWTPNINIFRDPRWGRGMETYGEDPYLTGQLGMAAVRGLQGDPDAEIMKTHACAKHYAVHSGLESSRHSFDVDISERDLRETYLPAFKDLVTKAGVKEVMTAYNRFRGVPCAASEYLVNDILRGEWGFEGLVVSDCWAIPDFFEPGHHEYVDNETIAAAIAVKNGLDVECGSSFSRIPEAVSTGLLEEKDVDKNLHRVLTERFRLGEMDGISPWDNLDPSLVEGEKHRQLSLEMACESMVLLKNNGVLPLKNEERIALLGPNADDAEMLWGNYNPVPNNTVTLLQAMQARVPDLTYMRACGIVDAEYMPEPDPRMAAFLQLTDEQLQEIAKRYAVGVEDIKSYQRRDEQMKASFLPALDEDAVLEQLEGIDIVVFAGGISPRLEGEEMPVEVPGFSGGDRTDIELPSVQRRLIAALHKAGKKVVFINFSGAAMGLVPEDENCDAILQAWYPGQEGGTAIADILYGDIAPSGKLPVTFYRNVEQLPEVENYDMEGHTYRYFKGEPLYPFGYGLTYTTFSFGEPQIKDGTLHISVTNSGASDGTEVIQLYVRRPDDENGPSMTLRGFQRVTIPTGQTVNVSFPLSEETFVWWDEKQQDMVPYPGKYELLVGNSSDIEDLKTVSYRFR